MMAELETRSGLSADTLKRLRTVFAATPGLDRVWLYGSRACGRHRRGSDIDLAVDGRLTHEASVRLSERLDALDLPYKIDLVHLDAAIDPALHARIRREGLLLFDRDAISTPTQ